MIASPIYDYILTSMTMTMITITSGNQVLMSKADPTSIPPIPDGTTLINLKHNAITGLTNIGVAQFGLITLSRVQPNH